MVIGDFMTWSLRCWDQLFPKTAHRGFEVMMAVAILVVNCCNQMIADLNAAVSLTT